MALGLLGLSVTYIDTSGAIEVPGQIVAVAPPRSSVESVHVLVRTSDARVAVWAGTSSDKIGDFSVGQSVTLLVKPGHEAEVDVGSGGTPAGWLPSLAALSPSWSATFCGAPGNEKRHNRPDLLGQSIHQPGRHAAFAPRRIPPLGQRSLGRLLVLPTSPSLANSPRSRPSGSMRARTRLWIRSPSLTLASKMPQPTAHRRCALLIRSPMKIPTARPATNNTTQPSITRKRAARNRRMSRVTDEAYWPRRLLVCAVTRPEHSPATWSCWSGGPASLLVIR